MSLVYSRWLVVGLLVLVAPSAAIAAVQVAPFATPEDLQIFGPEVARALVELIERGGVEPSVNLQIGGRIEALDRDRIRLRATVGAKSAQAEGLLEEIDLVTAELGARLLALVPAGSRRPTPRLAAGNGDPPRHSSLPRPSDGGLDGRGKSPAPVAPPPEEPPRTTAAPPAPAAVERPVKVDPPPVVEVPGPPEPSDPAPVQPPPPTTAAPSPPPPDERRLPPVENPYGSGYAVPPPARPAARYPRLGTVLPGGAARVVLHAVDVGGCSRDPSPDYAARDILGRELRFAIVPVGTCGLVAAPLAANEALRHNARAVVMAAVVDLRVDAAGAGQQRARGRLHVVVVRDGGQTALNREVEVVGSPAPSIASSRGAYEVVLRGLHQLGPELVAAVGADGR